jgi:hypothetical protein
LKLRFDVVELLFVDIRLAWVKAAISCGGGDETVVALGTLFVHDSHLCLSVAFSSTTTRPLCSCKSKTLGHAPFILATVALRASGASPKP